MADKFKIITEVIADLRSDTVTRPGKEMLEYMFSASVGDMVLGEDPMVNELEDYTARLFNKEAGLFCPSGTMTNQIAVKLHTQPGDDVICSKLAHIYLYEGGGISFNSAAAVTLIDTPDGIFGVEDVKRSVQPDDPHKPRTSLVSVENTVNRGGGALWNIENISEIARFCRDTKLAFHLDGARIFNAIVASGISARDWGSHFDTVSVCLSKGLGAPVGSVLVGSAEKIRQGKRIRKVLGGTMRQAGYIAAAGLYALQNNVERLNIDHIHARAIADSLRKCAWVNSVMNVETNIIIFETAAGISSLDIVSILKENQILASAPSNSLVRMVTHLDVTPAMVQDVIRVVKGINPRTGKAGNS